MSRTESDGQLDRPDNQPQLKTTLTAHIAALIFVMVLPTVATLLYFVVLSGSPWMKVAYFVSKVVQFAFPLLWVSAIQKCNVRPTWPTARSIKAGLVMGVLIVAIGLFAYFGYLKSSSYLQNAPERISQKVADMGLSNPTIYLLFSMFLAVPHSLLEEYYWRWFTFGQIRRVTSDGLAMVLSGLGFMAHHVIVIHQFLQQDWMVTAFFSLCVAFGGFLWAWLYARSRSLYGPWVSHLLVDCGIMYIGFDLIDWR